MLKLPFGWVLSSAIVRLQSATSCSGVLWSALARRKSRKTLWTSSQMALKMRPVTRRENTCSTKSLSKVKELSHRTQSQSKVTEHGRVTEHSDRNNSQNTVAEHNHRNSHRA